ncbi:MAG: SusD/RagB family nutrient-binding outer membrane lipoprotein [Saprospiraceae bacterium]|nr:SusD/RagB family nutrient-binding outer membrane lipoprotein [Saprospiraceae bacterium]
MKKILAILFLGVFVFLSTGCDDQLDINDDPLAATQVDPNLLFPEVFVNFSNNRTIEVSGRIGNIVQYYEPSLGVFGTMALGDLGNTFLVGNVWANYYSTGLKNLVLAENTAAEQDPANVNVIAQSKILQAFIYYNITCLWEDAPFSQAIDLEFPEPVFDSQEDILRGIVAMVDEASALLDKNPDAFRVDTGDMLFGGDLDKWEMFGNAIKLKALMLLANKDASVAGQIASTLQSPIIRTLADEAEFKYFDAPGNFNPLWNTLNLFSNGINPGYWGGSTTFLDIMQGTNDPRLSTYYDEARNLAPTDTLIGTGEFGPGGVPGSFNAAPGNSVVSLNILRPDFPDRYLTAAEVVLMEAEAIVSGYVSGDLAAADAAYREGIMLSMNYYDGKPGEIAQEDKDAYLASLPALGTLSTEDALEAIHLQLYVHNFFRGVEGWTQWRRTKVPDLVVPLGSQVSDILRRFFYPPDEKGANPNTPADLPLDAPMWFEN